MIKLAVWKFSSCDGCQLSLLDCEDELLTIAAHVELAYFPEATRTVIAGPYDLSLVEGSVSTEEDIARIKSVRAESRLLVSIGACASAGGIQSLRNSLKLSEVISTVYARPEYIKTLEKSHAISEFISVDYELRGCPISKKQLLDTITSLVHGVVPQIPTYSVCVECKNLGNSCLLVARGEPCLGPLTQAGCHALCPSYSRACFGCFGPKESSHGEALVKWLTENQGASKEKLAELLKSFNGEAFTQGKLKKGIYAT